MRNIRNLSSLIETFYHTGLVYKSPSNLSYFWNFGIYGTLCLVVQILSGIFLAMHYTSDIGLAFDSVEHIMRDINLGWLLRYIHSNGASMFFTVIYIHTFRGLYYSSYVYPRQLLWVIGVLILLIMIITAFIGYVLPWGQMSLWGATVITNLVSAVPFIGGDIVIWIWGGYSVSGSTLTRFFSLHYLFPFLILAIVFVHFIFLHEHGSNNPLGVKFDRLDSIPFYPYYIIKDLYGIGVFLIFYSLFIFFLPNYLGHSDNYIVANPMVTPAHIVPEWYFLPFYAILRSIPDKLLGVLALLFSIIGLMIIPFYNYISIRSVTYRPYSKVLVLIFIFNMIILGWLGGLPVEQPYIIFGQFSTLVYFFLLFILFPMFQKLELNFYLKSCIRKNK